MTGDMRLAADTSVVVSGLQSSAGASRLLLAAIAEGALRPGRAERSETPMGALLRKAGTTSRVRRGDEIPEGWLSETPEAREGEGG